MKQHHQRGHILKCYDTQIVKNTCNLSKRQEETALKWALGPRVPIKTSNILGKKMASNVLNTSCCATGNKKIQRSFKQQSFKQKTFWSPATLKLLTFRAPCCGWRSCTSAKDQICEPYIYICPHVNTRLNTPGPPLTTVAVLPYKAL